MNSKALQLHSLEMENKKAAAVITKEYNLTKVRCSVNHSCKMNMDIKYKESLKQIRTAKACSCSFPIDACIFYSLSWHILWTIDHFHFAGYG